MTPTRKRGRRRVTLTPFEEFVLTLVRIRRGIDIQHLAYLFGLSTSHVSRIFTTWVNLLAKCLKPLLIWPTKGVVKGNLPESFRGFQRTRCIIDCSEIYVEKPLRPKAQRITWSNYKHNNRQTTFSNLTYLELYTSLQECFDKLVINHGISSDLFICNYMIVKE